MRLVIVLMLVACGHPEAPDLYGLWVNEDAGQVRALDFAGDGASDHTYTIHVYAAGDAPTEVQNGSYDVLKGDGWELVTTVAWAADGTSAGRSFGNPIRRLTDEVLELEIDEQTGATRTYEAADALP